jgi:hypothetical protein
MTMFGVNWKSLNSQPNDSSHKHWGAGRHQTRPAELRAIPSAGNSRDELAVRHAYWKPPPESNTGAGSGFWETRPELETQLFARGEYSYAFGAILRLFQYPLHTKLQTRDVSISHSKHISMLIPFLGNPFFLFSPASCSEVHILLGPPNKHEKSKNATPSVSYYLPLVWMHLKLKYV